MSSRRGGLVAVVLALGFLASAVAPTEAAEPSAPRFLGRPLTEVLSQLERSGLQLIYSSAIVQPDLVVSVEPTAVEPRAILEQILLPLGLAARDGAGGSILIVRAAPKGPAPKATPDAPLGPIPELIEHVIVTPGHHELFQEVVDSTRAMNRRDALVAPTFGNDVSRWVTLLPGVAASDNSAEVHERGSTTRDVSFVLDGLELIDPYHLASFQSPFSFIDDRLVESVELQGGSFTAEHGDRHGGFVEVSSASPAHTARTQIELGTLNSRVSYAAPTARGGVLASARFWYPESISGAIELGEDGLRPNFGDAYVRAGLVSTPTTALSFHSLLAFDRAEFAETDGNERVDTSNRSGQAWIRLLRSWSNGVSSDTIVSLGRIDRFRQGIAEPADDPIFVEDDRRLDFVGVRQQLTATVGASHFVKGGAEVRFVDADYDYTRISPGDSATFRSAPSGWSIGAYAAYRAAPSDRVVTEVGLRWDRQTWIDDQQWSPRFHVLWRTGERSEFRLGAGLYHQSQRIHELLIEDGDTSFSPAERSRHVDLAYLFRPTDRFRIRIDLYDRELTALHRRYENLFHPTELFPEAEPDRVLIAAESAEARGAEILVSGEPSQAMQWWASYTWSTAKDEAGGEGTPRSWDQTHAVKLLFAYRWARGWFLSFGGTIHTGWPTTPVAGEEITLPDGSTSIEPVIGPRNAARFPTYWRLDAKAGVETPVRWGRVRVEIDVVNLTNRKNACCVDEFRFETRPDGTIETFQDYDYWRGFSPSVRVLWEF